MKRVTSIALSLAVMASMAVPASAAKVGEVVDYALHTEIVAQIEGHSLRSYNVGGHTAVVAEDLAGYGFKVTWDGVKRALEVERTMNERGEPMNPAVYPEYEKETLRAPVGSRAEAILSTDIKTYVAGKQVDAFNINGETLIWLSDLDCYGQVVWDAENKLAKLVLGDPMQESLDKVIQPLLDWAGENAEYQLYPGTHGTLFVGYYYGTSHGTACQMEYVDLAGNRTDIDALMPVHGFGAQYYLRPRSIVVNGDRLYFATTLGGEETHQMAVDLSAGKLIATSQMAETLSKWKVTCELESEEDAKVENALEITITKQAGKDEVTVVNQSLPNTSVEIQVDQSKVLLFPGRSSDPDYEQYPFGKAHRALARSNLPSIFRDEYFSPKNNAEQRRTAWRFFRVTYNDKSVSGDLFWIGKNGSRVLRFDFDNKLSLKDGDVVKVWVGAES